MRKLTIAASVALTGLVLALPSPAAAGTGGVSPCTSPVLTCVDKAIDAVVDVILDAYRDLQCAGSCVPHPCDLVWEDGCGPLEG